MHTGWLSCIAADLFAVLLPAVALVFLLFARYVMIWGPVLVHGRLHLYR